jgi:hypothetical protein
MSGDRLRVAAMIATFTAAGCTQVLGLRTEENHPFEHRAHVVEGIACTVCHQGIEEAGNEGPLHLPDKTVCVDCHEDPHDTSECSECHGLDFTATRVGMARHYLRFAHSDHLALQETSGNCARCHQDVKNAETTLLPRMATCLSCHAHEKSFDRADCDGCHENLQAEMPKPQSHIVHGPDYTNNHSADAAANRSLCETCHTQSQCASCHGVNVAALPTRLHFDRPQLTGLHRAGFRSRHGREALADGALCVTCHTENSCNDCHAQVGLAADGRGGGTARNPHPAGFLSLAPGGGQHGIAARQDPVSCAGCHGGAGEQLCVDCHRVGGVGGNIHPPGFESSLDQRTAQPCTMCHNPTGAFGGLR